MEVVEGAIESFPPEGTGTFTGVLVDGSTGRFDGNVGSFRGSGARFYGIPFFLFFVKVMEGSNFMAAGEHPREWWKLLRSNGSSRGSGGNCHGSTGSLYSYDHGSGGISHESNGSLHGIGGSVHGCSGSFHHIHGSF